MHPVRAEVSSDSDGEVENPENGSPGFSSSGDYTRSVPENTAKGMPVGDAVVAIDPNSDTLTYELGQRRGPHQRAQGHYRATSATSPLTLAPASSG